uniref:Transmembrane protein 31 n=1 Tax=Ailuropoda melanoleuca TaxID=9646 RepID=A0A7N5JLV6_AILME
MGLTNKSEGEQQPTPNNSDAPNEDQGQEIQQPEEQRTPVVQRTRRAGTQPSRCRLPSRRTPATPTNRAINLLGVLPWPIQWFASPYQLPAILQFYPEFILVFKEALHYMSHCLKAHVKEIGLPIILHLSALSTLHFHLPFLPTLLFLSFFILFVLLFLLLLLIILFILFFF